MTPGRERANTSNSLKLKNMIHPDCGNRAIEYSPTVPMQKPALLKV